MVHLGRFWRFRSPFQKHFLMEMPIMNPPKEPPGPRISLRWQLIHPWESLTARECRLTALDKVGEVFFLSVVGEQSSIHLGPRWRPALGSQPTWGARWRGLDRRDLGWGGPSSAPRRAEGILQTSELMSAGRVWSERGDDCSSFRLWILVLSWCILSIGS